MTRVKTLSLQDISEENKDEYLKFKNLFSSFGNQLSVYSHSPVGMKHLYGMSYEISQGSTIPKRLIEIAVIASSFQNRCKYCVVHHSSILADLGLDSDLISNINNLETKGLNEVEILVRDYAIAVSEKAWGIKDEMFERLKNFFNDSEIVELTMRIALTGLFNKVNQALGIEMEEGLMAEFMSKGLSIDSLESV